MDLIDPISIDEGDQADLGDFMGQVSKLFENVARIRPLNPVEFLLREVLLTGTLQAAQPIISRNTCRPELGAFVAGPVRKCMKATGIGVVRFHDEGTCIKCQNLTRQTYQNRQVCLFCLEEAAKLWAKQQGRN